MSSSVFKVYSSSSRDGLEDAAGSSDLGGVKETHLSDSAVHEDLKIDSNLVILVNKDGSVSVDQNTLQSLLANETTDTSVSVVRISSPTPSIENEIEEEQRRLKEEKQKMDAEAGGSGGTISSNEDSSEETNSIAGTSSGSSSVSGIATRRGRLSSKRAVGTTMEDNDDPRHVSLTVEAYYPPEQASNFAAQVLSLTGYQHPLKRETVDISFLKYTVMYDHCYTPLTSPTQKLPPRMQFEDADSSEETSCASTNRPKPFSLTHPISNIVNRRKSIGLKANRGGQVPVFPSAVAASANRRKSLAATAPAVRQERLAKQDKPAKLNVPSDPLELDDEEDEDDEEMDFDYSEEEETSYSEEDDDEMDADFSVGGRSTTKKRKLTFKSKLSSKTLQRSQLRKLDIKDPSERVLMKGESTHKMVKVGHKSSIPGAKISLQKQVVSKVGPSMKLVKKETLNPRANTSISPGLPTLGIAHSKLPPHGSASSSVKPQTKPEPSQIKPTSAPAVTPTTNPVVVVPKKEKKPKSNLHDAALFNDMSALFSTPDIIKKVNASKASTPTTPTNVAVCAPLGTTNDRGGAPAVVKSATAVVAPAATMLEEKPPESVTLDQPVPIHPSPIVEQRLDLINAIVQEDLRQPVTVSSMVGLAVSSQLNTQPAEIPHIVQMLETSASAVDGGGTMMNTLLPELKPMELVQPPTAVDMMPDSSILEALNSNHDSLPEDLLEHVAELAKNKKLQEILDKQVLGIGADALLAPSVLPMVGGLVNMMPEQQPVIMQQPTTSIVTFPIAQNAPLHSEPFIDPSVLQPPPDGTFAITGNDQTMARKEAILVRRSDGRVITLPPIEAPTTRASKRRAQVSTPTVRNPDSQSMSVAGGADETGDMPEDALSAQTLKPKPKVGLLQKLSSATPGTPVSTGDDVVDPATGAGELVIDESKGKRSNKVRQSVDNRVKRASTSTVPIAMEAAQDDDLESDESWNSEDDPDRLWCICRQPHNNRFMICCDSCEDWFHGKCVNITKAMGQQMEQDGIEWTCPNCLKKKMDRQQPKMTAFLISKSDDKASTTSDSANAPQNNCAVCGKPAKPSSIYCSDDCIRKHASNAVAATFPAGKSEKPKERVLMPPSLPSASVMSDTNVIIVMERKTGRCITGKNAPSAENLKGWLDAHPTFELVPPGSVQASIIIAKQAEVRKAQLAKEAAEKKAAGGPVVATASASTIGSGAHSPKIQTQMKITEQKKITLTSPLGAHKASSQKVIVTVTSVSGGKASSTPINRTSPSAGGQQKANVASSSTPAHSPTASAISKQRKSVTPSLSPFASTEPARQSHSSKTTPGGENIRVTVKKTLKEHLMQRTTELKEDSPINRLTEEEIDRFVSNTERELFVLFNKDTGMKYRAKYRSLVFNIKDRKNLSLFQKISEKSIEPKQLVRMTADELASQELAQWRENETKHQLEMIKKSELDLLACAKNYVLKTHKGEEVIEGKIDERVQLDPSAPVEDVVLLLNNSAVSSTSELDDSSSGLQGSLYRSKDYDYGGYGKSYAGIYGSGSISSSSSNLPATAVGGKSNSHVSGAGGGSASSSSATRKKESRRGSRSRSRSRGRKHDRNRSRDRSRSKHKRKRSRERSHDRERDKERDRERGRDRDRDRDRHHRGRERSRDRSKPESKGSREKDSSKGSSDKRRSSIATRGNDGGDSSTKITVEAERKEDKNDTNSKLVGASKKRAVESSKGGAMTEPLKPACDQTSEKTTETMVATKDKSEKERSSEADAPKDSVTQLGKPVDTATTPADAVEGKESSKESKTDQDQEPTSTVTIPTPPHYPYEGESPGDGVTTVVDQGKLEAEKDYWKGSVHMVDVASVEMSIRTVSGEIHDITKDFTEDLNICGTIKPEMVWEYIGQIKKSPNKEICLVRFHSTESSAYYTLYNHLYSRKRYSVVKTPSPTIKDFYIFPLPAEQMIPMILKPVRGVGILEGERKPNLLLGVLVKIKGGKRGPPSFATGAQPQLKVARRQSKQTTSTVGSKISGGASTSNADALLQQVITKYTNKLSQGAASNSVMMEASNDSDVVKNPSGTEASTRVGEEQVEKEIADTQTKGSMDMDIDMDIIKAPMAGKAGNISSVLPLTGDSNSNSSSAIARTPTAESGSMVIDDDDDAPYSPGGGSDDSNFADVTAIVDTSKVQVRASAAADSRIDPESERIQLAMDELNRKIAEEKNVIVGLISMAELKEDEINSALPSSLIQDIPIPSNLSEILASIKGGGGASTSGAGLVGSETHGAQSAASIGTADGDQPSMVNDVDSVGIDDEEYNPTAPSLFSNYKTGTVPYPAIPVVNSQGDIDERILPVKLLSNSAPTPAVTPFDMIAPERGEGIVSGFVEALPTTTDSCAPSASGSGESRLAKLSEAELLSMVPDDAILPDSSSTDA